MIVLIAFAFAAGVVTILSPCILPVLPIILSTSTDTKSKNKPFGVILGFVLSFTFFTLFLTTIVSFLNIPAEVLRILAVIIIAGFGVAMLVPKVQIIFEQLFSRFSNVGSKVATRQGFVGGIFIGFSLGLLWTPCVGPILASVISLALIGEVSFSSFVITFAYSVGTALPMLLVMFGGRKVLTKFPTLTKNLSNIQRIFGLIMLLTAFGILNNWDRKFQTFVLEKFPQYGSGLTSFEDTNFIKDKLQNLSENSNKGELPMPKIDTNSPLRKEPLAPEIISGGQWFNSEPLKLSDLRGKVVLVDFWTYSCINCQRTLPYLKQWWTKYKDDGLVIIGVHAPEFEFEKNPDNVAEAIKDFGLEYPIVQDNNFDTWRAYQNRYWPAKYLIDKDGYVRYTHFGEGEYDETERWIQKLLEEAGSQEVTKSLDNPDYNIYSKTPETYLGYWRMQGLTSPEKVAEDQYKTYTSPKNIPNNGFAFVGEWKVAEQFSAPKQGGELLLNFDSKNVFLVMRSSSEKGSSVNVYVDGKFVKKVDVTNATLYQLVELEKPGRHLLRIEFLDGDNEVYAFTFG